MTDEKIVHQRFRNHHPLGNRWFHRLDDLANRRMVFFADDDSFNHQLVDGHQRLVSQALTSATIAVGGFVAYRELAESEKSRHIDIADRLFDELNSQDNIAARKWVYMEMPSDPQQWLANSTDEGNQAIKRVLNSLDRVSFLTQEGWIPDDVIMPWMHPMIAKSWEKLEAYVKHERVRRQEPYFYLYAEKVAERCRQWRAKNGIEKSNWVDKAI